MVGPVSSSSSNPLVRFYQECESLASGIPQRSNGQVSLVDKITTAYRSAISAVEQGMLDQDLLGASDTKQMRIITEGSAKLALIDAAYEEALANITGPKAGSSGNPVGAASSAPQSAKRDPVKGGFSSLSMQVGHMGELGSAFLSSHRFTGLSSTGSSAVAAVQNIFQKIVKGLEVPRLHSPEAKATVVASMRPPSPSEASPIDQFTVSLEGLRADFKDLRKKTTSTASQSELSSLVSRCNALVRFIEENNLYTRVSAKQRNSLSDISIKLDEMLSSLGVELDDAGIEERILSLRGANRASGSTSWTPPIEEQLSAVKEELLTKSKAVEIQKSHAQKDVLASAAPVNPSPVAGNEASKHVRHKEDGDRRRAHPAVGPSVGSASRPPQVGEAASARPPKIRIPREHDLDPTHSRVHHADGKGKRR